MAEVLDWNQAKKVYATLCSMLDERGWRYHRDDSKLTVRCGAQGDDLPMDILIEIDAKRELTTFLSPMPFTVPQNMRSQIAVAVSLANWGMVDGSFDYDYLKGKIFFRLTSSYRQSLLGKNLFSYMLEAACFTIDTYNDKFLTVIKSEMSINQILEYIK